MPEKMNMKMSRKMLSVIAVALLVLALGWVWLFKPFWTVSQSGQAMREKALYAVIVVYYASDVAWRWLRDPFKVTDPDDPRFDPLRFNFMDYPGMSERVVVFRKIFRSGTERKYVDNVLVGSGGAHRVQKGPHSYEYSWKYWVYPINSLGVMAQYDADDRLVDMSHNGVQIILSGKPTEIPMFNNPKEAISGGKL